MEGSTATSQGQTEPTGDVHGQHGGIPGGPGDSVDVDILLM